MSSADFFKTYFDQVWRYKKISNILRMTYVIFKPNF